MNSREGEIGVGYDHINMYEAATDDDDDEKLGRLTETVMQRRFKLRERIFAWWKIVQRTSAMLTTREMKLKGDENLFAANAVKMPGDLSDEKSS